jgi:hypothetical protein
MFFFNNNCNKYATMRTRKMERPVESSNAESWKQVYLNYSIVSFMEIVKCEGILCDFI